MKKMNFFVVFSILALTSFHASAITSLNFFIGGQAMVNVVSQTMDGHFDQDPVDLFKLMNVEPQGSIMGPGKGIVTNNRDLNMTCGTPPGRGATCSFVFQPSPRVKINPFAKTIVFHAVGKEAIALSKLFVTNDGKLEFISSDKMLKLEVSAQEVLIEVSEQ